MSEKRLTAMRNKRKGKRFQAELQKKTGGRDIGTLGGEDVEHHTFSFEAKTFKKYRGENIMQQAEANCPEGKVPVAVVHVGGQRHEKDIVHMRFTDWEKIVNPRSVNKLKRR